jgi:Arylsulfotransferase (ASST)
MVKTTRVRGRRVIGAAVVLGAIGLSAAYGYLFVPRQLFPYRILIQRHGGVVSRFLVSHRKAHDVSGNLFSSFEDLRPQAEHRGDTRPSGGSGVLVYDRSRAERGLNFFTSAHAPVAMLMDMEGVVLRNWSADAATVFPSTSRGSDHREFDRCFGDAELLPDGSVLALFNEIGILRLDRDSRVVWSLPARVHHDLIVDPSGTIWALAHETRIVPGFRKTPVLDDVILSFSPDGKPVRRISILDSIWQSSYAPELANLPPEDDDVLHANSVIVLDGSLGDRSPAFRRGNLLVSSRNLSMVAVIDPDQGRVVWALTGLWRGQQSARLPAGHLVLFDDLGSTKASRVLEVDPFSQEVVWSFGGNAQTMLSSAGYVARLRGGNTLITETRAGRVREVTPDNRVVWEFVNPNRVGKNGEFVAFVYFMERVPGDLPFLSRIAAPGARARATGG